MLVVGEFYAMVVAEKKDHSALEVPVNVHEKRNRMAKHQFANIKISWPDDNQKFTMKAINEPEEEAVEFWDLFIQILHIVSTSNINEYEFDEEELVPFLEIDYPDRLRVYIDKKRVSLTDAHSMIEKGMRQMLRIAIESFEKELEEKK